MWLLKLWQIYNNNKFEANIQAGKCHLPLSRGPCVVGKIILASEEGTGSCATWNCKEDEVPLYKKRFHFPIRGFQVLWRNGTVEECIEFDTPVCSGEGERLWAKPDGG